MTGTFYGPFRVPTIFGFASGVSASGVYDEEELSRPWSQWSRSSVDRLLEFTSAAITLNGTNFFTGTLFIYDPDEDCMYLAGDGEDIAVIRANDSYIEIEDAYGLHGKKAFPHGNAEAFNVIEEITEAYHAKKEEEHGP